jgi:endonuclease YncB( thermonuclease family)
MKPSRSYSSSDALIARLAIHGRITGIVDGDTINVLILSKQHIRVRLAFVDAPERGQAFGQRAKQAMSELVFGKDVELQPHTIDRSGRLVARVLVDGQDAALSYLSNVFAGSTKKISVKRLR